MLSLFSINWLARAAGSAGKTELAGPMKTSLDRRKEAPVNVITEEGARGYPVVIY
jgi:hypothetical protein